MNVPGDQAEPSVHGRASGQGRVYQAVGDQHISEYHYHYGSQEEELLPLSAIERSIVGRGSPGPLAQVPVPDAVRVPLVGHTPKILRDRTELMESLLEAAENEGGGIHVLHGLGGCGKTSLAHAFFRDVTREGRRIGFWVNASDRGSLRAGMLAIAADQGAGTTELVAAHSGLRAASDLVWHYLNQASVPWLLVLDNADDPALLYEGNWLRESDRGLALVTTRRAISTAWQDVTFHEVGVLPVHDAAQVLRDLAPEAGSTAESVRVAEKLGCLPLALTLAGSYLAHQILESWSMADYEHHLESDPTNLIDQGDSAAGKRSQPRRLVSRTWQLSLEAIADEGMPEAATLMRLLSCWGADPVPLTLLSSAVAGAADLTALDPPLGQSQVGAALQALLAHSLVSIVPVPVGAGSIRCLQAHGVLLDSVAADVPTGQRPILTDVAVGLIEAELPADEAEPVRGEQYRLFLPHAMKLLRGQQGAAAAERAVSMAVRLVLCVHETGDYAAAYALAETAVQTAERLLGSENLGTLRARRCAGWALFRMGRFEEAAQWHRQTLEVCERVLGSEHAETLETCCALQAPLCQTGRMEEGVSLLRGVIATRERLWGVTHAKTLNARAALLEFLVLCGEVEEFEQTARITVEDCEGALGPDHPTTLMARHNYAFGLFKCEQPQEADPVARRTLADRERVQGAEHSQTLSAALLLGWIAERCGRPEEAIVLAQRVVVGQERALGNEHPYLLTNRAGLATSLAALGRTEEAREVAERNLPLCERVLGLQDSVTVETRRILSE